MKIRMSNSKKNTLEELRDAIAAFDQDIKPGITTPESTVMLERSMRDKHINKPNVCYVLAKDNGPYEFRISVLGVFSSKEKAINVMKNYTDLNDEGDELTIEEWPLDSIADEFNTTVIATRP